MRDNDLEERKHREKLEDIMNPNSETANALRASRAPGRKVRLIAANGLICRRSMTIAVT